MAYRTPNRNYRIAFISNSRFAADLLQTLAPSLGLRLDIHLTALEEALNAARELLETGTDLVIGCGSTGKLLQHHLGWRALDLRYNAVDLIRALQLASQVSRSICLPYYLEIPDGLDVLAELLHLRLVPTVFTDTQSLVSGISRSMEDGISCVVGSNIAAKIATAQGGRGFEIFFCEEEAKRVLEEAVRIVESRDREQRTNAFLSTIADLLPDQGLIGSDENSRIIVCNEAAASMLHCRSNDEPALQKSLQSLDLSFESGKIHDTKVRLPGAAQARAVLHPVFLRQKLCGGVAVFQKQLSRAELDKGGSFQSRFTFDSLAGSSPLMENLKKKARLFANTDAALLIRGETGTGKEILAHAVHATSSRSGAPFVALNCAALPESLLESELFGYESGAFTGARRNGKEGIISLASGGTVYLDEIGDISPALQVRLLRVLESREIMKVGGGRIIPVDVRVISSSWKNLAEEVALGRFRADLYYRLSVLSLTLPALRDRLEDIPEIVRAILRRRHLEECRISAHAMERMMTYSWPGNIRELDALVQRYALIAGRGRENDLLFDELFADIQMESAEIFHAGRREEELLDEAPGEAAQKPEFAGEENGTLREQLDRCERAIIHRALKANAYSKSRTARKLGISQNTLWRKLKGS